MRKCIVVACFLTLFAISAMAAEYPKAEIFGGYQHTRLEGPVNANGFNFALNRNFNEWFGITADMGTAYKGQNGVRFNNYTTFGPVLSLRANRGTRRLCMPSSVPIMPLHRSLALADPATASLYWREAELT